MFSDRTAWGLTPNSLARARERLLRAGAPLIDLTESNPTRCGFRYPESILKALADPVCLRYEPDPKGIRSAREAVASIYRAKGVLISPEKIILTSSTSEAYAFLLRLLCNPGDRVAVPVPSYPLFDYLAALNDVTLSRYPLRYWQQRWEVDFPELEKSITPDTRAVVVVHPNNPTGSCLTAQELERIVSLCRAAAIPLIADEVFADYLFTPSSLFPNCLGSGELLTFCLGGVSKYLGLPQMKVGWVALTGPEQLVQEALRRLEVIADTYLSVGTPPQAALLGWLSSAPEIQAQIKERISANRSWLSAQTAGRQVQMLHADGGWNAVLRIPECADEERNVLRWMEEGVAVYPGYFFDFETPGHFVLSLLPEEKLFQQGVCLFLASLSELSQRESAKIGVQRGKNGR